MKNKVSLKDIAQKAGVSIALVSYVLNNQKLGRIRKEVVQKIQDTAKELNYHTNQIARSLKTNKTNTIGLLVANISNPFFSSLARIIEDEAEKNKYTVIFCSSDESAEKSEKLINTLLNHQVDGLIIAAADNTSGQIQQLQENGIPLVLIDRYFPQLPASYVAIDNFSAAYEATSHLIDSGKKNIGMITYATSLFHLQERKRGFIAALKEHRLPVKKRWMKEVNMQSSQGEVERSIDALLSEDPPVEALLFASNTLSTFGLKYINTLSLTVPDNLAIASFDQSDAADLFYAPLTHIRQPLQEMGQKATQILLENIGKNNKITTVNMKAELVIGRSTSVVQQPV